VIVALPDEAAVATSVAVWLVTCFAIGRWAVSWPDARLERAGPITRIRAWEDGGRLWVRRLRVLRWKDRLPEAGAFFAGGRAKRSIGRPTDEALRSFRRETIRAERVHWSIAATGPLHLLWCRPTVGLGMVAFGVLFDAPFIVVQRANRGRIERVLARRPAVAP
jgi:glycosyl-4,4'-diaponeurosporenoate acyltransferase